jgi:hypothetical protein
VPMRFKRPRIAKLGLRSVRLSKHGNISADAQRPSSTLIG